MAMTSKQRRYHGQERGAALFLVVLVISMVTAVGVFSMRAASLSNVAAGYSRQNAQAAMLGRLAAFGAAAYVDANPNEIPPTVATAGCASEYVAANPQTEAFCKPLKGGRMEGHFFSLDDGLVGQLSVSDGTGSGIAGSVIIELAGAAIGHAEAGTDQSSEGSKTISVTITSRAQVYPFDPTTSGVCTAGAQESISEQRIRRHITVPSNR